MSEPQAGDRATMWAIRLHEYGDPHVLRHERVERPQPAAGEVLVRVAAAGVNPVDWKTREGRGVAQRNALPLILGWDIAGDVAALGAGVTGFAVGDPVFGLIRFPAAGGGYAEYATAPAGELARRPAKLAPEAAAAVPLAALTAWQGLFDAGRL
ncbi:MAG TPA: alcohol dehydrogenase catalytic domain-containing protein, partial [Thermoanaerobaculia bacterium]